MTDSPSSSSSSSSSSSPLVIKDRRYQRGKVYEITVLHEDYKDDSYVGSTICKLSQRFGEHKTESEKDEPTKKLHILMKTLGMRFFKIVLIEEWSCDSKEELCKREQYHINLRKPTLNMIKAHMTKEERSSYQKDYREENKVALTAYKKDYYEENKVAISAQMKIYQEENKEAITAWRKDYYEENKETILAQHKDYYKKNKVAISARMKIYQKENKEAITAWRKGYDKDYVKTNREKINARRRANRAKAKLSYKDKVVLAVKEALALRAKKREAGQP